MAPKWRITTVAANVKDLLTFSDKIPPTGRYFYVVTGEINGKESAPSNEVAVSGAPVLQTHLKFDENGGALAADVSGHAHNGTLQNGVGFVAGKNGSAISLDGKDDFVSLPNGLTAELGDFTMAAWVYLNASQTWARLFDFGDNRGRYFFLTPRGANSKLRFVTSTVYGYNEQTIDGVAAVPINQWVHIAVTLSGRVGTLYVNGVTVGSNPNMDFPPFQIGNTNQNWIGRSQYANDPYLNGKVDDFRIYDGALDAAAIADLANQKTP